jgi:arylsulfatase
LIDIMITCIDVADADYSTEIEGQTITPLEGESLVRAFADKAIEREALYWEHERNRAVRVGDWKLVAKGAQGPWELYDMARDRTELDNLAAKHPKRVEEMAQLWERWAERSLVKPYPDDPLTSIRPSPERRSIVTAPGPDTVPARVR